MKGYINSQERGGPKRRSVVRQRGVALVIVLAFVVLVTGLVVAFMSSSIGDSSLSNSSATLARADLLSEGAVNTIIGDLQTEMAAGSSKIVSVPSGDPNAKASSVYLPSQGGNGVAAQPFVFTDSPRNVPMIKRSANKHKFFQEPTPATAIKAYPKADLFPASDRAISSSTSNASLNGRSISLERWNKPLLFSTVPPAAPSDPPLGVPAALTPDWVVVSRNGSNPTAFGDHTKLASIADRKDTTGNDRPDYAVGRYAYMIYDEGALLDVNAVGSPSFTPEQVGKKGSLPLADLRRISLTQTQINTLVGWRNTASIPATGSLATGYNLGNSSAFYNLMTGTGYSLPDMTGFLTVPPLPAGNTTTDRTDKMFSGRQELIRLLLQGVAKNTTEQPALRTALMNLGTFTREKNSPSWMPKTPTGSNYDYAAKADDSASLNRNIANVLVPPSASFTRVSDGTLAKPGEPLVKYRFPLARLNLFNSPGSNTNDIRTFFSMQLRSDGLWEFVDIDNNNAMTPGVPIIKTLDQVAKAGKREANFWELLQAGILSSADKHVTAGPGPAGSLGIGTLNPPQIGTVKIDTTADLDSVRHLLAIGLSIIDQYDTNDDPTVLSLQPLGFSKPVIGDLKNRLTIAGDENLPGFYLWNQQTFRDTKTPVPPGTPATEQYIDGYLQFLLWNPHRNAADLAKNGPVKFRIRANGESYIDIRTTPNRTSAPVAHLDTTLTFQISPSQAFEQMAPLHIVSDTSVTPSLPGNVVTSECSPYALYPANTANPASVPPPVSAGFLIGQVLWTKTGKPSAMFHIYNQPLTFTLEKQDNAGHWLPYSVLPGYGPSLGDTGPGFDSEGTAMNSGSFDTAIPIGHGEPRTSRFGAGSAGSPTAAALKSTGFTPWNFLAKNGSSNRLGGSPGTPFFGDLYDHLLLSSGDPTYGYTDNDAVVRKSDGEDVKKSDETAFAPIDRISISPFAFGEDRPAMLNRAFTSVAEMGYAFRDEPWKSIDFASSKSADGGLLDLFTVNSRSELRAGVFNPNNASVEALTAVLRGAYQDSLDVTYAKPLDADTNTKLAQAIYSYLHPVGSTPRVISNRSDLTAMVEAVTITPTASLTGSKYKIKRYREAIMRAMSDFVNTRTWNLLIDVIAQSGRYGPNTLNNGFDKFIVEGERRLWVHLAIDRYTGEVLERQVESVNE